MRVGGHRMREHVRLLLPLFAFVAVVWLLRLLLAALGVSLSVSRIFSVTTASAVGRVSGGSVDPFSQLRRLYECRDDEFALECLEPNPDRDRHSVCRGYWHRECLYLAGVFRAG